MLQLCLMMSVLASCSETRPKPQGNFCQEYEFTNSAREKDNLVELKSSNNSVIALSLLYDKTLDAMLNNELNWEKKCKK